MISEIISKIVMKERQKYEDKKVQHSYLKRQNLLLQHDIIVDCSFSYPAKLFLFLYSESEENKYTSSSPFSQIFSSSSQLSSSLRVLTFTLAELHYLQLLGPFSSVARLTLSMLHLFIADIGSKVSQLLPSSVMFQNIFQTFDTRGAREIDFNMVQFEKHYFQFCVRNSNSK